MFSPIHSLCATPIMAVLWTGILFEMSRTWVRKGLSIGCVEIDVESLSTYQIDLYIPTAISYFTCCPTSLQGTVYKTATSWVRSVLCCSNLVYHRPQLYELLHVFCCVFIESATDSLAPPADSAFLLPILFDFIYLPMEPRQQIHG